MNKKILKLVEDRLLKGERKYGNENVTNDGRDFIQEALEEALDCAVYVSAKLVEIQKQNKGVKMGRAIDMENRIDDLTHRLKLVENALEEMVQTRIHHVDLTDDVVPEGVTVEPDKEFTPPTGRRKKAARKKVEATT